MGSQPKQGDGHSAYATLWSTAHSAFTFLQMDIYCVTRNLFFDLAKNMMTSFFLYTVYMKLSHQYIGSKTKKKSQIHTKKTNFNKY